MDRVNLLILDECHHCTGNSNYARIMRDFYHALPVDARPKVLGLTASPLINLKINVSNDQLEDQLRGLERLVDARIISPEDIALKDVDVQMVQYEHDSINSYQPLPLLPDALNHARKKEFRRFHIIYDELGPFIVNLFCERLLATLERNAYESETEEEFCIALEYLRSVVAHCNDESNADLANSGRTSKVRALESLLLTLVCDCPDSVGIVFVKTRATAIALHHYIQHQADLEADKSEQAMHIGNGIGKDVDPTELAAYSDLERDSSLMPTACSPPRAVPDTSYDQFADAMDDEDFVEVAPSINLEHDLRHLAVHDNEPEVTAMDADDQFADADSEDDTTRCAVVQATNRRATMSDQALPYISDASDGGLEGLSEDMQPTKRPPNLCYKTLRSDILVRQQAKVLSSHNERAVDVGHEARIQRVINRLRQSEINILFATSVVEEGVDVRACSFIIAFDEIITTKSYVQMKGRARQLHSKFFAFQNSLPLRGKSVEDSHTLEMRLTNHMAQRTTRSLHVTRSSQKDSQGLTIATAWFQTKHAVLSISNAKSLLYRYMASVPFEAAVRSSRISLQAHMPLFDYESKRLILPAHISSLSHRIVSLPESYVGLCKRDMEMHLCFLACARLHELGLLNDRLLPICKDSAIKDVLKPIQPIKSLKDIPHNRVSCLGRKKRRIEPSKAVNNLVSQEVEVFVYPIIHTGNFFNAYRATLGSNHIDLAIVTLEPLDESVTAFAITSQHPQFKDVCLRFGAMRKSVLSRAELDATRQFFRIVYAARWKASNCYYRCRREADPVRLHRSRHYTIGCVDSYGNLLFKYMDSIIRDSGRNEEQRIDAVRQLSTENQLAVPRIWRPLYDLSARYIVYGPAGESASFRFPDRDEATNLLTYQDYFRVKKNVHLEASSPLFHAQQVWRFPRKSSTMLEKWNDGFAHKDATPDFHAYCHGLCSTKLPQCQFEEMPGLADSGLFLLSTFLPQLLYQFERLAMAFDFKTFCLEHLPVLGSVLRQLTIDDITLVLTAKSCAEPQSYEKLEWLGDAVLKLVHTDCVVKSRELKDIVHSLHEGQLDYVRSALGENKRFAEICKALSIDNFIMTASLSRGKWIPAPLELVPFAGDTLTGRKGSESNEKLYADVVEALLGLVYLKSGFQAALKVAQEMQATIPWIENDTSDHLKENQVENADLVRHIATLSGYWFDSCHHLAIQALTHPTVWDTESPSYQKLEWIGDAVLSLATRDWILRHFPDLEVGEMVAIESALVCNESLGFLSFEGDLVRHMRHNDSALPNRLDDYVFTVRVCEKGLWGSDPPKCIADILEAVLGAIHVHGGLAQSQKAALHILQPVLDLMSNQCSIIRESYFTRHPKSRVHELSGELVSIAVENESDFYSDAMRNHSVWTGDEWRQAQRGGHHFISSLRCGDVCLIAVVGRSGSIAINHAWALVLAVLNANLDVLDRLKAIRTKLQINHGEILRMATK
ncbi:hypothetical protein MPSEU_000362200 [Mayamaea pseudoterrestris]|nr:hypothetical protein MPSEU_000362200 [Mayamaea pseudoterrestris]